MKNKYITTTLSILFFLISFFIPFQASAYYTNMPASLVVGQTSFTNISANQGGSVGPNTVSSPRATAYDPKSGKFFVVDISNQRVLIYNKIPTSNNASADVVIGQQNFTSNSINQGGSPAANTLRNPGNISFDPNTGKLIICDNGNIRVLIYNQIPTTNNASADVVIGQQNFTSNSVNQGGSVGANTLAQASQAYIDPRTGKLLVADGNNRRILIFNQIPTTNNASADVVIGQQNFTSNSSNQGGSIGPNTLASGGGAISDPNSTKLFVTDNLNHRVLVFNQIPTSNNASADVVIGQADFTSGSANQGGSPSNNTLSNPVGTLVDPDTGRLFISDGANNRLLIYNQVPTSNNALANVAIGQADFTHNSANQGGSAAANTLNFTFPLMIANKKLFAPDGLNNRVLVFNDDITAPGLSISPPQSVENNFVKFSGNATTITNYIIQNVQYMVNGGGFNGATPSDGSFDSVNENFFFTFDPKTNNNTNDGYTVQTKSSTSNADVTDHLFYFQPFGLNTPNDRSFISQSLPTFSFSVNKQQTQLKENISKYRLMLKKSGGEWVNYIDNIPVDYNSVQSSADNLQPSTKATNGNGNYEDKKILVTYSNNNSTIAVASKAIDDQGNPNSLPFDQSGKLLSNGGYEWKIQAVDKNGHVQETETRKFVVGSSQFSNGSNWFPLQISSISGLGRVYLSTISPQFIKPKYRIQTSSPIFKGVATANSTVQLDLTNQTCLTKGEGSCVQTFSANSNGASQFTLSTSTNTLKTGNVYQAQFSVSQNGLFNALPPFVILR